MRGFVIALLLLSAGSAQAAWVKYAENNVTADYYDPTSVKRAGDGGSVWTVFDYKKRQPNGALSYRIHYEYKCNPERYRILSLSCRAQLKGEGSATCSYDGAPSSWENTKSGTMSGNLLQVVCAKPPA